MILASSSTSAFQPTEPCRSRLVRSLRIREPVKIRFFKANKPAIIPLLVRLSPENQEPGWNLKRDSLDVVGNWIWKGALLALLLSLSLVVALAMNPLVETGIFLLSISTVTLLVTSLIINDFESSLLGALTIAGIFSHGCSSHCNVTNNFSYLKFSYLQSSRGNSRWDSAFSRHKCSALSVSRSCRIWCSLDYWGYFSPTSNGETPYRRSEQGR